MKLKLVSVTLSLLLTQLSYGVATVQSYVGIMHNSSGVAVANDTLWVLIGNTDGNGTIWGTALDGSISTVTANSLLSIGQSIDLGTVIGGDTIIAMGGVNNFGGISGYDVDVLAFTLGVNGVAAGQSYAIAWFSGVTFSGTTPIVSGSNAHLIGSQVGMINRTVGEVGAGHNSGMVLPGDGGTISAGAATTTVGGNGTITTVAHMSSVVLVPEPSSALLAMLGGLALLRRKRND